MPAKQLTVADLDRMITDIVKRQSQASNRSDQDYLRREYQRLSGEKDKLLKQERQRADRLAKNLKEAEAQNKAKDRLNQNYRDNTANPGDDRRRTGTAGDAAREQAARDARSKNPPRGNIDPNAKPRNPQAPNVGDKGSNKPKNDRPIGTGKGEYKPTRTIALLPLSQSSDGHARKLVDKFFPDVYSSPDKTIQKIYTGNDPLTVAARFSTEIQRMIASTVVLSTPIGGAIDAVGKEIDKFRGIPAKAPNVTNSEISSGQIATLVQSLFPLIQNMAAAMAGVSEGQKAILNQNSIALQALQTIGTMTSLNPMILSAAVASDIKLRQVNFAAIQKSADNAAKIATENKVKLGAANFTLQNQAAALAKQKLEIIDATQLMQTSRLAQKKWDILDATQLMQTSRLAEKKWNILDATQLMQTSRLAERKWDILDATQLMQTSRLAEKKWGILDVTQLMKYSRAAEAQAPTTQSQLTRIEGKIGQPINLAPLTNQLTRIEGKIGQPINLAPLTNQLTRIEGKIGQPINFAPLTNQLTRIEGKIGQPINFAPLTNQLTRIETKIPVLPVDLARKSDVSVTVQPVVKPTPVTVNPTPVTVNPTPVTVNPTPVTVNAPGVDLSPITGQIANFARSLTQTINNQTTNITNVVNNAPKTDLKPVLDAIAPLSTVLGVPLLKNGLNFGADKTFTDLARKSSNGSNGLTIPSIPELIMAAAAIPYARQGLHRLGGNFDKSVMVPSRGQVKITDTLGFQKWAFDQIDERLGMPTAHSVKGASGQMQAKSFRSVQDTVEEVNALTLASAQDLEVVERYLFALTQDLQKLMQIALQTREDVDLVISDLGCKYQEVKRSHPTHINLKEGSPNASLEQLFQNGRVYYVGKKWADASDKNQRLERIGYDTQIAAMSNKFEFDKTAPELPLDKSRATRTPQSNELWRTFVNTLTDPPEGYTAPGNPIPEIKEITTGTPKAVPKPTNPSKKLGQ